MRRENKEGCLLFIIIILQNALNIAFSSYGFGTLVSSHFNLSLGMGVCAWILFNFIVSIILGEFYLNM